MRSSKQHWPERALSRRQFLRTAAGVTGGVLGAGLWFPPHAWVRHRVPPRPIPGGVTIVIGDEEFPVHHYPPASGNEPSDITDLNGHVGNMRVLGTGVGRNTDTGEETDLLFQADVTFMQGEYIGEDGRRHEGTFAFVWLDLYDGQVDLDHQVHDYNPGITDSGLVWTVPVPAESVSIHLESGRAALRDVRRRVSDFGNLLHALRGDPGVDAEVSFDVRWGDVIRRLAIRNEDVGFEGHFVENHAAIEWSARQEGFEFVSDPIHTSETVFAVIGRERNGVFFR